MHVRAGRLRFSKFDGREAGATRMGSIAYWLCERRLLPCWGTARRAPTGFRVCQHVLRSSPRRRAVSCQPRASARRHDAILDCRFWIVDCCDSIAMRSDERAYATCSIPIGMRRIPDSYLNDYCFFHRRITTPQKSRARMLEPNNQSSNQTTTSLIAPEWRSSQPLSAVRAPRIAQATPAPGAAHARHPDAPV